MKKLLKGFIFFIGWLLSPFTWWNDEFINIPLSYLLANLAYAVVRIPFKWLVIGFYWFTNIIGIYLMYFGAKFLVLSAQKRLKAVIFIIVFMMVYTAVMLYLDSKGVLVPLCVFFQKYCVGK